MEEVLDSFHPFVNNNNLERRIRRIRRTRPEGLDSNPFVIIV